MVEKIKESRDLKNYVIIDFSLIFIPQNLEDPFPSSNQRCRYNTIDNSPKKVLKIYYHPAPKQYQNLLSWSYRNGNLVQSQLKQRNVKQKFKSSYHLKITKSLNCIYEFYMA